jgi:hypothetical protein
VTPLSKALWGLKAIMELAGPGQRADKAEFHSALRAYTQNIYVVLGNKDSEPNSALEVPVISRSALPPNWLVRPWERSALAALSFPTVWYRLCDQAMLYISRLSATPSLTSWAPNDENRVGQELGYAFFNGAYGFKDIQAREDMCAIVSDLCALPPAKPEHRPRPICEFLPWPMQAFFLPSAEKLLFRDDATASDRRGVRVFDNYASEEEREKYLLRLYRTNMLEFSSEPLLAVNGNFGIYKNAEHTTMRAIKDNRNGNALLIPVVELGERYAALRATDPDRAEREGAPTSLMELINGSHLQRLPGGVVGKAENDLVTFFHFFYFGPLLAQTQGDAPIDAARLGIEGLTGVVWPYSVTMSMGHVYAPLLAQAAHRFLMRPLSCATFYRRPEFASTAHKRRIWQLRQSADHNNTVPASEIPLEMWQRLLDDIDASQLGGALMKPRLDPVDVPGEWRIPVSAFYLERAEPADERSILMLATPVDLGVNDLEVVIETLEQQAIAEGWCWLALLFFLYIDDHHAFPVCPESFSKRKLVRPLAAHAANDRRMLQSLVIIRAVGLKHHPKKLRWSHRESTPSLGYLIDFDLGGNVRVALAPEKFHRLAQLVYKVTTMPEHDTILVRELLHIMGVYTWAVLVQRPFLSVFFEVYTLTSGVDPSARVTVPSGVRRELKLMAHLDFLMTHTTRPLCDVVGTFDACSIGYGVAYRRNCPRAVLREFASQVALGGRTPHWVTDKDTGAVAASRYANRCETRYIDEAARFLDFDWKSKLNPWKAARWGTWTGGKGAIHINIGEAIAGIMTMMWFVTQPVLGLKVKIVMLGDNQAMLGAFNKGRSSSPGLNRQCRLSAAIVAASGSCFGWLWFPSHANPADDPSRRGYPLSKWRKTSGYRKSYMPPEAEKARREPTALSLFMGMPERAWVEDTDDTSGEASNPGPQARRGRAIVPAGRRPRAAAGWFRGPIVRLPDPLPVNEGPYGLIYHKMKVASAAAYVRSTLAFCLWEVSPYAPDGWERQSMTYGEFLSSYVVWAKVKGSVSQQQIKNLLANLALLCPLWKRRGTFDLAWRSVHGWSRLQPKESHLPVPREVLTTVCAFLVRKTYVLEAYALLLGFHGYLRHAALRLARVNDVAFQGDVRRLGQPDLESALIFLPKTKTTRHSLMVDDPLIRDLLKVVVRRRKRVAEDNPTLFDLTSTTHLLEVFRWAQVCLGWDPVFDIHSLRHGGAGYDFHFKKRDFEEIRLRGHWKSQEATKLYLQDMQSSLEALQGPVWFCPLMAAVNQSTATLRLALRLPSLPNSL